MARCVALVVLGMAAACTGANVNPVGRPCSDNEPCGPGTSCDPMTGRCVADQVVDSGPFDLPTTDLPQTDSGPPDLLSPPDLFSPDIFQVPDGGCPAGYTVCGAECAKLSESFNHCGACGNACPPGVSNQCVAGKCVCGSTGGVCTGGLNCKAGQCTCIFGGECQGCCDGNTCLATGGPQSVSKCGSGGVPCASCADGDPCTQDTCDAAGQCQSSPGNNGASCDDSDLCTHTDECSNGQCAGTTYSCSDGLTCTTDTCTGQAPPNECTNALQTGHCLIGGDCYAGSDTKAGDSCYECSPNKSTSDWSPASGCVFTFAGTGTANHSDGPALSAQFDTPSGVVIDSTGKIYVTDRDNHVIRLIDSGQVTTFAGTPKVSGGANGAALSATFNQPNGLALNSTGTKLYVAEWGGNRVRLIQSGQVTTFAGSGAYGYVNGAALTAEFRGPFDVAVHGSQVFVADRGNNRIRLVENGQVSRYAGSGTPTIGGFVDGPVDSARFNTIHSVAVDGSGNLYVADFNNHCIRLIAGGQVTTFAGQCQTSGQVDGAAAQALFNHPAGVTTGSGGKVYVSDEYNQVIRMIDNGQVSTVAGSIQGMLDGPVAQARFHNPRRLAVSGGLIYVPDADNDRIRLIRP